jgi:uncharacterized protein YecT (DUF1311 family)
MFTPSSLLRLRAPEFHETPMIFRPLEAESPHPHLSINPVHISAAVSIACVMGMGLGLWMRADVDRRAAGSALRQATPRAAADAPAAQRVQIALAEPDEEIAPAASLMDVGVSAPPLVAQTGQVVDAVFVEAPSFDCRSARTLADQMVCVDPALAEADRRLSGAYKAALGSGADHPVLARSQARWLAAREAAARTSPEALASLYEKRISELAANENPARPAPSGVQEARVAGVDAQPVS